MIDDMFKVLGEHAAEILFEIITESMDDYLYIFDLQDNTMEISQSATDRFMISQCIMNDALTAVMKVVYEDDRRMLEKHLADIREGKEKVHNLHYRWLDKNGLPIWVACRGIVIDDNEGHAKYLVGCMNETGNKRRADNVTGLLGGPEFIAYLRSQAENLSKGFLVHIGIDDFGSINSTRGAAYGDYILRSVAGCMKKCLTGSQRIYHLVADQYVIVDLEAASKDQDFVVLPIGKKAVEYSKRNGFACVTESFSEIADISVADCFEIANLLCGEFKNGEFGHIDLCYTKFVSMLSQQPDAIPVLPLDDLTGENDTKDIRNLILYEPDASEVFEAIVPEYLAGLIYGAVCESVASELAARRTAMEAATNNAEEMIEKLNLHYNRARQASITQEITEIVGGAEGV